MHDDIFERLEQATSEEQKTWVITEAILKSLPIALAEAVIAVAVPHWFNLTILAALLQVKSKEVERLYYGLQALPFTETFGDLGYTLHNLTRSAILFHLISNNENLFRTYSQRVYNHYAQFEDTQNIVEAIYHLLISEKTVGLEALTKTMEFFRNKSNLSAANRLIAAADELIKFKLLDIEDAERIKWYKYLLTAEINDTQKISFIKIAKTTTANKS